MFTNVEENCAIVPFVYDMVLKDFIVERLGLFLGGRHTCDLFLLKQKNLCGVQNKLRPSGLLYMVTVHVVSLEQMFRCSPPVIGDAAPRKWVSDTEVI